MTCVASTAGIDGGQMFLDLGFHPAGKPVRCANAERGIARLADLVKQRGTARVGHKIKVDAFRSHGFKCGDRAGLRAFSPAPRQRLPRVAG